MLTNIIPFPAERTRQPAPEHPTGTRREQMRAKLTAILAPNHHADPRTKRLIEGLVEAREADRRRWLAGA
jgi:hypothetical protein